MAGSGKGCIFVGMKRFWLTLWMLAATAVVALANWPVPAADGRTQFPTTGVLRIPVVLVDFADVRFPWDYQSRVNMALNGYPGDFPGADEFTAAQYFKTCSGGRLDVRFEVAHITLPKFSSYFDKGGNRLLGEFLELAAAKDPALDFARFDADQDGMLDTVIFIYAGESRTNTDYWFADWSHHVDYTTLMERVDCGPISLHGKLMDRCALIPQQFADGSPVGIVGPVCHEVCHVLGIPDMATLSPTIPSRTPGVWSVMDTGCLNAGGHCPPLMSAYERWYCRWLEPEDISLSDEPQRLVLPSAGTERYRVLRLEFPIEKDTISENPQREYLLLESRTQQGWDRGLPGEGLLVWHVLYNQSSWEYNVVNTYGNSRVSPAYSDIGNADVLWPSECGISWYLPELSGELLPRLKYTEPFHPVLTDVRYDALRREATAILSTACERPEIPVRLNEALITGHRQVTVSWQPCEADTVFVSIWAEQNSGKPRYVDGCCNEVHTAPGDTLRVLKVPEDLWEAEHYVSVTPVRRLPAEGDTLRFIPKELNYASSIEDIALPADAIPQYYTITGLPLRERPTEPGLYLRRTGRRTEKIFIR